MHNERIIVHVFREAHAIRMMKLDVPAGCLTDPARKLHTADIVWLCVMSARLGNQHLVSILQPVNRPCASDQFLQIPLMTGKQDGE
ncbi:hypothetical protein D3C80_1784030 [compost metagenome]